LLAPSVTRRLITEFAAAAPQPTKQAALADLSEREREVLVLVARGLSNGEIADALMVGEATVKTHVSNVLGKLGLRDRVQAAIFAYEAGLVRAGGA
jgi:DNA-binding NarL/FixJ family response regulator